MMPVKNFIIGFPRCGTSYLRKIIQLNFPERLSYVTEPQYFDTVKSVNAQNYHKNFLNLDYAVDISPTYILSGLTLQRIQKYCPTAKLIIILRDPFERDLSARNYVQERGRMNDASIANMRWIHCGREYHKYVDQTYNLFPAQNIKLFLFNDLIFNPEKTASDIFQFFDWPIPERLNIPTNKVNQSVRARYKGIIPLVNAARKIIKKTSPRLWSLIRNNDVARSLFFSEKNTQKKRIWIKNDQYIECIQHLKSHYNIDLE